ncbi:MAG: hypothetical protein PUF72_00955 [Clostridiales bacterium]|nr:hypothetical protein [Clostridiales bacterium]
MAKNTQSHKGRADVTTNLVIGVVIAAVLALAVYAVYDKISAKLLSEKIASGEAQATVGYLAEQADMSVEDYLAQYGLSGLGKKTTEEDMVKKMTMENYAAYSGTTLEEIKTQYALESDVDASMLYEDFEKTLKVRNVLGGSEDTFDQIKETYELDDSITMDSMWTDVEPILEEKQKELQEKMANATEPPAEGEADAETAEAPEATEQAAE